jgi:HEAT repeat protein
MKKSIVLLVGLLVILQAFPAMAERSAVQPIANKSLIEDNLFDGMASENLGLQRNCALMLGQIQSTRAVIPLMVLLQNSTDENLRIAAAWSLCKIGDERGIYAVKLAARFDESKQVQTMCAWYYEDYQKQGSLTLEQPILPLVNIVQ